MPKIKPHIFLYILTFLILNQASAADPLWLNYQPITNPSLKSAYTSQLGGVHVLGSSETIAALKKELSLGYEGLLGLSPDFDSEASLIIGKTSDIQKTYPKLKITEDLGSEGYLIRTVKLKKAKRLIITAHEDIGLLYGVFHLLRLMQTQQSMAGLDIVELPKTQVRILNHWDNLDRTSERGYAGFSIWDWHRLPDYIDHRYIEYARLNAALGINSTVLTNVNANALVLTPSYLKKVQALAKAFRPYGIKVYLTARFSAPIEIGQLPTADPTNEAVRQWWKDKVKEIYTLIPDFGGFLVKANSEGQPGPQNYGQSHAEGANMMAEALEPYGGIVMWRAFVYSNEEPEDRAKQAYTEFVALDGQFLPNVMVQIKNGAIDFQPREPFHPLFGALKQTPSMMEFQITQEYLGQATQLVYLGPMYEEVLRADTYAKGEGSTVAKVIDGSLFDNAITGIAGVANIGTDENWTGHPMGQANWYVFGKLAWNPELSSREIAAEWIECTYGLDDDTNETILDILMKSHEASVNYMTPLGLAHLMGTGHHYGPAPWVDNLGRADWNPYYYHRSDSVGIGVDRTKTGTDAISQYEPPVAEAFYDLKTCPEKYLLWFHHVSWDHPMKSGRTLWEELCFKYQSGIETVREIQTQWASLQGKINATNYESVRMLLKIQEKEAIWWKDACLLYFQQFSNQALPDFVETPTNTLDYYKSLTFPFAPGH